MTITTEIAEQDCRALRWRLFPKFLIWLPAVWLLLTVVKYLALHVFEKETADAVRYLAGKLLFAASVFLISLVLRICFRRKTPSMDPLPGTYTFDLGDRSFVVTNQSERREFLTREVERIDSAPDHFFILMRSGSRYMIPKRGLTREQEEAVKSFGEAVAFASLHVDMLAQHQMSGEEALSNFNVVRWIAAGVALLFPFTLVGGLLPTRAMVVAVLCGAILLGSALAEWRSRSRGALVVAIILVCFFGRALAGIDLEIFSTGHMAQWVCIIPVTAGLPLLLFPCYFRRLVRIEDVSQSPAPDH